MTKLDKPKMTKVTLVGIGTLLTGIAAVAALFMQSGDRIPPEPVEPPPPTAEPENLIPPDDQSNEDIPPDIKTPQPTNPSPTGTQDNPHSESDDGAFSEEPENPVPIIDPAEITTDYYQEPLAIRSQYLGKTFTVKNTFNASDVEPCLPVVKATEEGMNTSPSWNDNATGNQEYWCISKDYGYEGVSSVKTGIFRCHFSDNDAVLLDNLNAELFEREKNNEGGLKLTLRGKLVAIWVWGTSKSPREITANGYLPYFSTHTPHSKGKPVSVIAFSDCKLQS